MDVEAKILFASRHLENIKKIDLTPSYFALKDLQIMTVKRKDNIAENLKLYEQFSYTLADANYGEPFKARAWFSNALLAYACYQTFLKEPHHPDASDIYSLGGYFLKQRAFEKSAVKLYLSFVASGKADTANHLEILKSLLNGQTAYEIDKGKGGSVAKAVRESKIAAEQRATTIYFDL